VRALALPEGAAPAPPTPAALTFLQKILDTTLRQEEARKFGLTLPDLP